MTESKEWVTIKIPKEVRGRASDLDATYEEVMKCGCAAFEDTEEPIELVPTEEWRENMASVSDLDGEKLADEIDEGFNRLLSRLDDLQAQLPKDVATELER